MKKLLIVAILGLLLIPTAVSAYCGDACCPYYNVVKYYDVSYFDASHDWVTTNVDAWTAREAAAKLGLDAGKDCFVGYDGTDFEPILNTYKVSYSKDGVWTVEFVEAEDSSQAADMLGLRAGFNCFVSNV